MPTTRLSSAVNYGAGNSLPSKNMPSCIPEKLLCDVCGKGFHHAAVLGRHRSLHMKDKALLVAKTYPCKACGLVFKNTRALGYHRCSRASNNIKTEPKLNRVLKHEAGLEHKNDSLVAPDFLKHHLPAESFQSIPVVPVQNSSSISEGFHSKSLSTVPKNIQGIKKNTAKKSPTLLGISSKNTCREQPKKDMAASEISIVSTRKLKPLTDIDIKSSRIQRNCTKISQSKKSEAGSKTPDVQAKNILVSPSRLKNKSETVPITEKKKGRKPSLNYTCNICHKNFISQKKLQKHGTLHDPSKPFGCDVCGKFFDDARFVKTHRTLHEKKSRKECNVCGKVFNERIFFDIHCLTHVEQKPFRCDVCEDIFKDKTTFIRHCKGHKARTRKVAERFLSMKEVLKQKLEDSNRQS